MSRGKLQLFELLLAIISIGSGAFLHHPQRPHVVSRVVTPLCAYRGPFEVPLDRIEFSYSRCSGPGGQNVNKLNTRVELRFNVTTADWLPIDVRSRLIQQQKHRINKAGELVIATQEYRTQLQNRDDAVRKLEECLEKAAVVPKERNMRTGLTDFQKKNRLREKKRRSQTKSLRRNKNSMDD